MSQIVDKLPDCLRYKWIRKDTDIFSKTGYPAKYADLVKFVEGQAKILLNPRYTHEKTKPETSDGKLSQSGTRGKPGAQNDTTRKSTRSVFQVTATPANDGKLERCSYCRGQHPLMNCEGLQTLPRSERNEFLKRQGRCFRCLERGHLARNCEPQANKDVAITTNGTDQQKKTIQMSRTSANKAVAMAVLPVKVRSLDNGVEIITTAFLDNGAGTSFITDALAKKMGLTGQTTIIDLSTMTQKCSTTTCRKIRNLEVKGVNPEDQWMRLGDVYTHNTVPVKRWEIPRRSDTKNFTELEGIDLKVVDAPVGLLLGADATDAIRPLEIIPTTSDGPYAIRTRLGWTLLGPVQKGRQALSMSIIRTSVQELNDNLTTHFNREFNNGPWGEETCMSLEEERFMQKLKKSTHYTGSRYEVGLPLSEVLPVIPDSRPMAKKRLEGVLRRMQRDERYAVEYWQQMDALRKRAYIEQVPDEGLDVKQRCYLPHHGVTSTNRNSKLRIVFDGSAKQNGISINTDILMKGPGFTNRFDAVLLKFREGPVAVSSDIQSMFPQIQIPENDRNWYRFLWVDDNGRVTDWRWTVHPFGSKPSPSIACHALNCGLVEQADDDTRDVSSTARDTFYVDDYLDSSTDIETAQKKVEIVDQTCLKSGFVLRKWASNRPDAWRGIPPTRRAEIGSDIQLGIERHTRLPTLGMRWESDRDKLTYRPPELTKVQNRRQLLSNMTKLFDPLGLVSPWILNCRLLVQTLCKLKLTWDEPIPPEYLTIWENWRDGTREVAEIEFDRCVTFDVKQLKVTYQLHVFSDYSMKGHGVAAYTRTHIPDKIESKLVNARSRVNPMKGETISKAELVAATLGAKTTSKLKEELCLTLEKTINWTDSKIVIEYLRNESIKSEIFTRNRVGTILTHTTVQDWRHVPGREKPADIASRGGGVKELSSNLWQNGPDYLKESEDMWPKESLDDTTTEHTTRRVYTQEKDDGASKVISLLNNISKWERILRFTQTVFGAVDIKSPTDARRQARLTVVVKVEWIMNCRPLTVTSCENPNVVAITPNHLMGIKTVETDVTLTSDQDLYRSRWKQINYITDQVWKKFHVEFVLSLQERQKQQEEKPNLAEGDIVVVQDSSMGRSYWPLG